ncbi:nuclear pore complex protein NUP50A-like [Humulus lupulus]|uniref:nuclear pore complex protein NUP50A-like n=1 Tax=Humulus lupulus TaxID=3486 RepID=UPI002B401BC9|nr:nuclear pore complex protein NUP50A-like [Humulus lupulus]
MGDAENALPPSKKRAAGREISRDNPGLDDDDDASEQESGTFKRASEEVLATRRIVKVRRQPSAPSSNPFAGIRLLPTAEAQAAGEKTVSGDVDGQPKTSAENEKGKDDENKQSEVQDNDAEVQVESKVEANTEGEVNAESAVEEKGSTAIDEVKPVTDNEPAPIEHKTENNDEKGGNDDKNDEKSGNDDKKDDKTENADPSVESTPLSSFQQLSSSQNAFTNLSGTGFSSSTFSFGSIAKDGSAFGTSSVSLFGSKTDQPSFGLGLTNNGNSSLFGTSSTSAVSKSEGSGFPSMQEVEVETGEENEEVAFNADSALYEFMEGGWKERGKGELKINVSKPAKDKARLLMRTKGNYRLILNASLFPDIKLTSMDKKGVSFACVNSNSEGAGGFSTYALKFKDPSVVEEFRGAVTAYKGKASTVLNTPENSPKASDE